METSNCLGIFMDHLNANIIEFTIDPIETTTIESAFTHDEKAESLSKSEHLMHNKENNELLKYYKKLGDVIKNYANVLLFGPTDAKTELFHLLRADHGFDKIKLEVVQTDKMTENQQHAFVKHHFSRLY